MGRIRMKTRWSDGRRGGKLGETVILHLWFCDDTDPSAAKTLPYVSFKRLYGITPNFI